MAGSDDGIAAWGVSGGVAVAVGRAGMVAAISTAVSEPVTAPIGGTVIGKPITVGETVGASFSQGGVTPVAEIVDMTTTADQMKIFDTLNAASPSVTVIDVRADPNLLNRFTRTLTDIGFLADGISADGNQHRWTRGPASLDVLLPEGIGTRARAQHGDQPQARPAQKQTIEAQHRRPRESRGLLGAVPEAAQGGVTADLGAEA